MTLAALTVSSWVGTCVRVLQGALGYRLHVDLDELQAACVRLVSKRFKVHALTNSWLVPCAWWLSVDVFLF